MFDRSYLVISIDSVSATAGATDAACRAASRSRAVIPPVGASLSVRTVSSHVSSVTTDAAYDVGRVVLLLRTIVLAMADLAAVLTGLVFVVTKRTVQGSQLPELVSLELVLAFGDGGSLDTVSCLRGGWSWRVVHVPFR